MIYTYKPARRPAQGIFEHFHIQRPAQGGDVVESAMYPWGWK